MLKEASWVRDLYLRYVTFVSCDQNRRGQEEAELTNINNLPVLEQTDRKENDLALTAAIN